jgi:hypothetical protein
MLKERKYMLELILVILVLLWLTGNLNLVGVQIPNLSLLVVNGRMITLIDLLVFLVILWAIGVLPSPIREIAGVILVLWVLSVLGFIALAGLSNILVIAVIVGLIVAVFRRP